MVQKAESGFRKGQVMPFLKTLKNTKVFPIQQMSICGTPDLLLCCQGAFVALELKSEEGEASALQKYNLEEVKRCKGVSIVAAPQNWEAVKKMLTRLDNGESHD